MSACRISIVSGQNSGCTRCGQCCRRWHVALSEREIARLRAHDWQPADDIPANPVTLINGHPFVAHRADGDCVYLDPQSGLCRLHVRFGLNAKPLGCRVYPLNISSTFPGDIAVTARMDCPAIRDNVGAPLTGQRSEVEQLVREMGIKGGFSTDECDELDPAAIRLIADSLARHLVAAPDVPAAVVGPALGIAVERLRILGTAFLNDLTTLEEVMPSFLRRATLSASEGGEGRLGAFNRALFREILAAYLRRDEEMIGRGFSARIRRTWALARIFANRGSPRELGAEHPDITFADAHLFDRDAVPADWSEDTWEVWRRFAAARLSALQFFGVSYYGTFFFTGLRALAMTYPLVFAAARCHATARGAACIEAQDVSYAVGAIDHAHGRSLLLQMPLWRSVEKIFSYPRNDTLLASLGANPSSPLS